ncbi:hypothetical protein [Beijerinckia sp. L45]|uniref:hypothetical protein n=1 Tax=Beijerinckia sp. L45 TaxID=1641855 RepID=UPI00131B16C2|nr:hypothetical protein [Beijerinckia sp. L45]
MMRSIAAALVVSIAAASAVGAQPANDLRDFRVGMIAADIKSDIYESLTCQEAPETTLATWADFGRCPKTADGLHAVGFRYRDDPVLGAVSEDGQGTKVAGQPVVLALLIDDAGVLAGLYIQTDPSVRLFTRRRADIFALQAMARYGEEGWACAKSAPTAHAQPIGETFVNDECRKTANGRDYVVDRMLFRDPDRPLKEFVSKATVTILRAKS